MRRPYIIGSLVGLALGSAAGLSAFTFIYARGYSYATNDPNACANCHVMQDHYDAWTRSSHHAVAACNDCHTPHDLPGKYLVKALNGLHHPSAFTTGHYPDVLRITPRNAAVTEQACRHCHQDMVDAVDHHGRQSADLSCTRCHSTVGHMQ